MQVILKYKTLEEVIERSNDTEYGLASGIVTKDIDKALVYAQSVRAGSVWCVPWWNLRVGYLYQVLSKAYCCITSLKKI